VYVSRKAGKGAKKKNKKNFRIRTNNEPCFITISVKVLLFFN